MKIKNEFQEKQIAKKIQNSQFNFYIQSVSVRFFFVILEKR